MSFADKLVGQSGNIFAKRAEHHLHEAMSNRITYAMPEHVGNCTGAGEEFVGQIAEGVGEIAGHFLARFERLERKRIGEDAAEGFEPAGNLFQLDDGFFGGITGEVSADFDGADIAGDGERRVIEGVAVLVDLPISFVEGFVFVLAFVFPGEAAAFPDVDETGVAFGAFGGRADDFDMFFEAVILAGGIGAGRGGLAQEMAKIEEMLMARGTLGELRFGPLLNKFFGS